MGQYRNGITLKNWTLNDATALASHWKHISDVEVRIQDEGDFFSI
jgi:hypothetical protein